MDCSDFASRGKNRGWCADILDCRSRACVDQEDISSTFAGRPVTPYASPLLKWKPTLSQTPITCSILYVATDLPSCAYLQAAWMNEKSVAIGKYILPEISLKGASIEASAVGDIISLNGWQDQRYLLILMKYPPPPERANAWTEHLMQHIQIKQYVSHFFQSSIN